MKTSLFCLLSALSLALPLHADPLLIHEGDTLAYLGDRGTFFAQNYPNGFIQLVQDGLKRSGITTEFLTPCRDHRLMVNLGEMNKILAEKKPQWLIFTGSSQDVVWRFPKKIGLDHDSYKDLIRKKLDEYLATGTKVLLVGCSPSGESLEAEDNVHITFCNDFLRDLAAEKGIPFVNPFPEIMELYKTPAWPQAKLTHTTQRVTDLVIAKHILRGMGVAQETIDSYVQEWNTWPDKTNMEICFTVDEYRAFEAYAREKGNGNVGQTLIPIIRERALGTDASK